MKNKSAQALNQLSIEAQRKKAAARRAQVKELRDKGLSGPEIAAELGVKLRTVYHDFSILKREAETAETEKTDG